MRLIVVAMALALMAGCTAAGTSATGDGSPAPVAGLRTVETQRVSMQSAETLVPYSDLLTYSAEWPELSRQRIAPQP